MSAADREAGLEALHTAAPAGGLRIATHTSYPPNRGRGELRAVSARDVIVRTGRWSVRLVPSHRCLASLKLWRSHRLRRHRPGRFRERRSHSEFRRAGSVPFEEFVHALGRYELVGSMGRVGPTGDNAALASFFSLLQKNVLDRRRWGTREELRIAIVTWIERTCRRRPTPNRPRAVDPDRIRSNRDHTGQSGCGTEVVTHSPSRPDADDLPPQVGPAWLARHASRTETPAKGCPIKRWQISQVQAIRSPFRWSRRSRKGNCSNGPNHCEHFKPRRLSMDQMSTATSNPEILV